ncbi:noggin 5 [Alosa alosa]|uniref:noggin 5 n=1 Tax=Alosa alosa TaxID=278164 RepID=UPI00201540F5|nr:noggin 5 [Alosa alosa]
MRVYIALTLMSFTARFGVSQYLLRVRPSPSDHLPVLDLKEDLNRDGEPSEEDLSVPNLKGKLGDSFDSTRMSIGPPTHGNLSLKHSRISLTGHMPRELRKLNLNDRMYGQRLKINKINRQKFRRWLWAHTYCPVLPVWKDLGVRFWPRYIKEGRCTRKYSCSVPKGMYCKPNRSVHVTLLRWRCQGSSKLRRCYWIHVQYPVISKCECSC